MNMTAEQAMREIWARSPRIAVPRTTNSSSRVYSQRLPRQRRLDRLTSYSMAHLDPILDGLLKSKMRPADRSMLVIGSKGKTGIGRSGFRSLLPAREALSRNIVNTSVAAVVALA